jgi:Prokaryotic E2 family E
MVGNAVIDREMEELREKGFSVARSVSVKLVILIIEGYPLPAGWSKDATQLMLKLPVSYPNGKPDMFWTDEDLLLAGGGVPHKGDVIEEVNGKKWRRFSWHPKSWTPGCDDIHTFLAFVDQRLAQVK